MCHEGRTGPMLKAEDKRHAHAREMADEAREDERERERRAVIGTARAMYEFFDRLGMMFSVALENDSWWSDGVDVTLQPPSLDDQKAVLGQLTSSEAEVVTTTMRVIELLRTTRDITSELGPEGPTLGEVSTAHLKSGRTAAQDAARCLWRVAELPTPQARPTLREQGTQRPRGRAFRNVPRRDHCASYLR